MSDQIIEEEQKINLDQELPEEISDKAGLIEALIFAHGEPLSIETINELTGLSLEEISQQIADIQARCHEAFTGLELVQIAGKFQFRTKADFAAYLRKLKASRPRKLSGPALETLAIVAYRQPIVKSDIETLRGVDCTPVLHTLLDRELIRIVGHQASVGNPALYGTTEEFLKLFGLGSLSELPTLRDMKEFEDPGEVQEQTPDQDQNLVANA